VNAIEDIFGTALSTPAGGGGRPAPSDPPSPRQTAEAAPSPAVPENGPADVVPTTESMSRLAARVMGNWRVNVDHRRTSGVDARLTRAILAQTCTYTETQKQKLRAAGIGEEIYSPITNTKVRAAKALLMDIFQANGDYPFTLRPTADPELPQQVEEFVGATVKADVDRVFMALAQTGRVLTPQGEQMLQQIVGNLYASRYDDALHRREEAARIRAKRMEKRVQDYFDEGGFVDAFQQYVDYICTYGTGIIRGPIPKVRPVNVCKTARGVPKFVREYRVVPSFEAVNPCDCYPAPSAKDLDDGPLCIRVRYSSHELAQYVEKAQSKRKLGDKAEGWMWPTVQAVLDRNPRGCGMRLNTDPVDTERRAAEQDGVENPADCMMEGVLCYDSVRGSELIEIGVTRNRDGRPIEFRKYYQVETIVLDGYVVYCRIVDDRLGRPLVKGVFYELPGSWWGESIADKLTLVQSVMNNACKALMRNMAAASGPMYYVNDLSRLVDRDGSGLTVRPHKVWGFQTSMSSSLGVSSGAPMGVMDVPSKATELLAVWEKMKTQADDDSGIPAYTYGQASGNSGAMRTAQGLAIFTEAASRGMKMVIGTTDRLVTRKLVKKTADYILLYDPDFDIKGDCEVVPAGIMGKILRAQQSQERLQFINVVKGDPDLKQLIGPKGLVALLRPSVADLAINPDDVLPSEERVRELEQIQFLRALAEAQAGAAQAGAGGMEEDPLGGGGAPAEQPRPGSVAERRSAA